MADQLEARIALKGRTPLQTVIPLSTPFVLQVEPANICNIRCRFCAVGDHDLLKKSGIRRGFLTMAVFRNAIDCLSDFDNKIKTIHLYGNGEPLINKNYHEMIKYAQTSGLIESIDTTTNGLLLTPEKIEQIIGFNTSNR